MYEAIPTQPRSENLNAASLALLAVIEGTEPGEQRRAAGAALAILNSVHPPYPPLDDSSGLPAAGDGLTLAAAHLDAAIEEATSAQEAVRIGFALRRLQELAEASTPDDEASP